MDRKTVHHYFESALRVARIASVGDGDALESKLAAAAVVGAEEEAPVVAVVQIGR